MSSISLSVRSFRQSGFALPTILLASVILLTVLLASVASLTAVRAGLNDQYYEQIASEAAESGINRAEQCLRENSYVASWSNTAPLTPQSNCAGAAGAYPSTVLSNPTVTSTYSVGGPQTTNGVQVFTVTGTANLLRTSSKAIYRSYGANLAVRIAAAGGYTAVPFGYWENGTSNVGSYFGYIDVLGNPYFVGANFQYGQLGNGSNTNNELTPTKFALPTGVTAKQMYTNFVSGGTDVFVLGSDGKVYGAGSDAEGQLGNGQITSNPVVVPQVFGGLPAGFVVTDVYPLGITTFVMGYDPSTGIYAIYSAGDCIDGVLGWGYPISGCSNQSVPQKVNLSIPSGVSIKSMSSVPDGRGNFMSDRFDAYVVLSNGTVYGWGDDANGELGDGTATDSSSPVQIPGVTNAIQVGFNGGSPFFVQGDGSVVTTGDNTNGELAGGGSRILSGVGNGTLCLTDPNNSTTSGTRLESNYCGAANVPGQHWRFMANGTIETDIGSSPMCLDDLNYAQSNGNPITIQGCTGADSAQHWFYNSATGAITFSNNPAYCVDIPGSSTTSGTGLQLYTCNGTNAQDWGLNVGYMDSKISLPSGAGVGGVTEVTTDDQSVEFLTSTGEVWGAGYNGFGNLGNLDSSMARVNPVIQQFKWDSGNSASAGTVSTPPSNKAVDVYTTYDGVSNDDTFVVLADGSVWGAGSNQYGQLGNGTTSSTGVYTPVKMNVFGSNGILAKQVQSGEGTTVILTTTGQIYTVGNNSAGQLGDGTTNNNSNPQANKYTNPILPKIY